MIDECGAKVLIEGGRMRAKPRWILANLLPWALTSSQNTPVNSWVLPLPVSGCHLAYAGVCAASVMANKRIERTPHALC